MFKLSWQGLRSMGRIIVAHLGAPCFFGAPLWPTVTPDATWGRLLRLQLSFSFSGLAPLWRCSRMGGKAPRRYPILPAWMCKNILPRGNLSPMGKDVGDKCYPWVTVSTAPRSVQHDGAQNVLMELLPLFSVSFSALFPSYFLGSLPKINTFEKCLVSRSAFPQKAGLRPMGLVSVP